MSSFIRMQNNSPSPHSQFFSSLRQVEKRLKLEDPAQQSSALSPPPPGERRENTEQTDSLGTPIYLNYKQPPLTTDGNISTLQESEVPREFLTDSADFPPIQNSPPGENHLSAETTVAHDERSNLGDDIELLMQLLQLSDSGEQMKKRTNLFNVGCDDGFYRKIAGLKGPKSLRELERLEGWINHFLNGEEREPFVLAHLLLAKAALWHSDDNCDGFGGFEFPSTIDEFLEKDPPLD